MEKEKNLGTWWGSLETSQKHAVVAFLIAIPVCYYLVYHLFAFFFRGFSTTGRLGIYAFAVLIATGMWAGMLTKQKAMQNLANNPKDKK